jgi:hypothetical protein
LALLIALVGAACDGGGGDGDSTSVDATFGNISRATLTTVTVPAQSQEWVTPNPSLGRTAALTTGGSVVNAFVFNSNTNLYIDGIKVGDTTFYEFDAAGANTAAGDEIYFYYGVWNTGLLGAAPTAVIPPIHTRSGAFPSGDYSFKLTNPTGSDASVTVYQVRKTDDNLSGGQLALNFYIYRVGGEENAVIPDESAARDVANKIGEIFSQAGVSIGTLNVEFRDDDNAIEQVLTDSGLDSFLESASRGSAGRSDAGINCFLLPRLVGGTLGKDGSIPGPAVVHGTATSGLVAMAADLGFAMPSLTRDETNKWVLAKILAHEIGHYVGLFHTTEKNGSYVPALTDVPRCGKENDADSDGEMAGSECIGKGASQLMFWTYDQGLVGSGELQITLSTQEGQMLNTFPAVN